MALNFPNSPSLNDTHIENGIKWQWDGSSWVRIVSAGNQGFQGVQGAAGSPGGAQGTGGAQGVQGATGPQGVQGAAGSPGGAQGTAGAQGVQGATGPQGVQGTAGSQGNQGVQGAAGAGSQGVQGATGAQGVQGATGTQGVQGATGAGSQGNQGVQGATNNLTISTSPPGSPSAGDMWWDSDDAILAVYYDDGSGSPSAQWVEIAAGPNGNQGAQGVQGTAGSVATNYTNSLSNSVQRTIQSKLDDFVNIKDFGAVGDNSTDDATAVSDAIGGLPSVGGCIYFPQTSTGIYKLDSKPSVGTKRIVFKYEGETLVSNANNLPDGTHIFGFRQQGSETSFSEVVVLGDDVDQEAIAGSKVNGFKVLHKFGGSDTKGGRHGIYGYLEQTATTNSGSSDRNYVGMQGQVKSAVNDGGTDSTSAANSKGSYFGMSSIALIQSGATHLYNVTGAEINSRVLSGASCYYISGLQIATKDEVQGSVYDCALAISKAASGTTGKKSGILFGNMNGSHPVATTGNLIETTGTATVANGIDFTGYTFSDSLLKATGVSLKSTSLKLSGTNAGIELGSLSSTNTPVIDFHSSGNNIDYDARLIASGGDSTTGNGRLSVYGTAFRPQVHDDTSLGESALRWSDIYAVNSTITNSDERLKQDIEDLSDAELRVATALKGLVKKYRFRDAVEAKGDNARIHVGVMAQQVIAAFESEGLDPMRYGIVCYDEWDAELDSEGNELVAAGNRYSIRYEELLAFIIAAL